MIKDHSDYLCVFMYAGILFPLFDLWKCMYATATTPSKKKKGHATYYLDSTS